MKRPQNHVSFVMNDPKMGVSFVVNGLLMVVSFVMKTAFDATSLNKFKGRSALS